MYNSESKSTIKLPEPSLRRLPWYLAYIKLLQTKGEEYVSSTQIAKEIGVDSSKIAKDLSFINISGKTRVGYEINSLVAVLEEFLGFTSMHKAFIFGVGSLGAALMQDSGLSQYGLEVVAGFDVKPELAGTFINHIPVYPLSQFTQKQKELGVQIGILTVPIDQSSKCDRRDDSRRYQSDLELYPLPDSSSQTYSYSKHIYLCSFSRYVQSVK